MAKYKCIAYCRVSKHTSRKIEDEFGNVVRPSREPSIEEQVSAIKSFVESHSDEFELVAEPFTEVKSGSSSRNRTQFKEVQRWMTEEINGCNTLLVYMKDRIARNAKDYMNALWIIKGNDGYIFSIEGNPTSKPVCVTHNVDEKDNDGLLNILMDAFDAYAYETYLEGLSKRSVARNERRVFEKNETYLSGFPHYGYKLVLGEGGKKIYEIAEDEAEVIRIMFNKYIDEDWGFDRIANYLNEQGYKYRKNANKQEYYCKFTSDSVRRNLQFEGFATGNAKFFQTENILRRKPIANKVHEKFDKKYGRLCDIPEDELNEYLDEICETQRDYVVENVFPIIIDKETYSNYISVKANRGNAVKQSLEPNDSGWLAGIGYCACGAKLYAMGKRTVIHHRKMTDGTIKDEPYTNVYKCSKNALSKKSHRDVVEPCEFGRKGYSYHIDEVILHFLKGLLAGGRFYKFYAESMSSNMINKNADIINYDVRISNLKDSYDKTRKAIQALNMDYADGLYSNLIGSGLPTEDDFKLKKQQLKADLEKYSASINELTTKKNNSNATTLDVKALEASIKNALESNPAELFKIMLDKVAVGHFDNTYQIRMQLHHFPNEYNPVVLLWDGRRSNTEKYKFKLTDALEEALAKIENTDE